MSLHDKASLRQFRRELRKNLTPQEAKLWKHIRFCRSGFKFRRQHSIGNFIVDFYCAEKRLIIEVDGGVHLESKENDAARDEYLQNLNYKVVRFWNSEIESDLDRVIKDIKNLLISC